MIGEEVGEKCCIPTIKVWAVGGGFVLTSVAEGFEGSATVQSMASSGHSVGWLTPPSGWSILG